MKFEKTELIRFRHCDAAGIVFYPRYFEMLNDIVEDFFAEALNYSFKKLHETEGIPSVNLNVQFKKPARLGDVIKKSLWVHKIGGSSLVYKFIFLLNNDVIMEGEGTVVFVDITSPAIKSKNWTAELKSKLEKYIE